MYNLCTQDYILLIENKYHYALFLRQVKESLRN
jgi:hypothetical protein